MDGALGTVWSRVPSTAPTTIASSCALTRRRDCTGTDVTHEERTCHGEQR
jgi:hypothetical protein